MRTRSLYKEVCYYLCVTVMTIRVRVVTVLLYSENDSLFPCYLAVSCLVIFDPVHPSPFVTKAVVYHHKWDPIPVYSSRYIFTARKGAPLDPAKDYIQEN